MEQTSPKADTMDSPITPFGDFNITKDHRGAAVAPLSLDNLTNHAFNTGEYFDDRISQSSFDGGSFPSSRNNSQENSPVVSTTCFHGGDLAGTF